MTILDAIILGIVEGLTEFLPVSSTGHLILAKEALGLSDEVDPYLVGIQLGAIGAVFIPYWDRIKSMLRGVTSGDASGRRLMMNLFIAFLPAACIGLLLNEAIEATLFGSFPVAIALIVGGVVMIVVERMVRPETGPVRELDDVKPMDALVVGIAQCFSLIPGTSRSMSTIVGAQLRGFTNPLAADFSFLLALPTLGAATIYSLIKGREGLLAIEGSLVTIPLGIVVSFFVAWAAIAGFLAVVKRIGMAPFGVYRIAVGGLILALYLSGWMA
jgi:undecaprenyl-diphosphatase